MPLDPSIILEAGQINDPNKMLALKANMQRVQLQDQQLQTQNALKAMLADPRSYANGQLTAPAKQAIFAADPKLGLDIQRQDYSKQALEAQIKAQATKEGAAKFGFLTELAGIGVSAYDEAKSAGKSEEDARSAAIQARNDAAEAAKKTGSGLLTEDDYSGITAQPFDPEKATALAGANKDWAAARARAKTERLGERRLDEQERHNLKSEEAAGKREDRMISAMERKPDPADTKWQVLTDPTNKDESGNPVQYRYNPQTGESTSLDAKKPYSPGGAAKLGSQTSAGLSDEAATFAAERILAGDPNATVGLARSSANIAKVDNELVRLAKERKIDAGTLTMRRASLKADSTSLSSLTKMTDAAVSFENTASKNFDLALKLAPEAVPTDWGPMLNKWIEQGERAIGDENVPPYQAALLTAANEYAKIMSGSTGAQGSTVDSRREAAELFSPYLSKGQIGRVVEIAKKDMANRKASLFEQVDQIKQRIGEQGKSEVPKPNEEGKPAKFGSASEVVSAYKSGKMSRDEAAKILRDNGWAE